MLTIVCPPTVTFTPAASAGPAPMIRAVEATPA
jgi:hypothetical protein